MSPAAAPTPAKKAGARVRKPVVIEQIGADDWAGGKGHIKAFILGGPDTGKTRWASSFPRPLYLGCEPTVAASIASRKIAYEGGVGAPHIIRINEADRPSDATLDALDFLKKVNETKPPGGLPKYQTAVLDTLDGLQRLLKDEWVQSENAGMFTGRDAWGFIEAKINLVLTRLMNLDMNVVILCHLKDKELEEQVGNVTQKRTVYEPLLQGSVKDNVFNDFDLVGLMKREIVGDTEYRGISFDATNTFPFLKDHYNLTAPGDQRLGRKFWPVVMDDGTKGGSLEEFESSNYTALWSAIVGELDSLEEGSTVEEVPLADGPAVENVAAPAAGGPVPPAKAPAKAAPAKVPAKAVAAAPGNGAAPTPPKASEAPSAPPQDAPAAAPAVHVESEPASAATPPQAPSQPASASGATTASTPPSDAGESVDPGSADGADAAAGDAAEPQAVATSVAGTESASPAAPASVEESATAVPTQEEAVATVQETLGGEVVAEGATADVAVGGVAAQDHGGCPICGKDMSKEQPDLVQLSRLKHRTLVLPDGRKFYDTGGCCYEDYQSLNEQKASGTGLYAA